MLSYREIPGTGGASDDLGTIYNGREEVQMTKTLHVIPKNGRWVVVREGHKADRVYTTQQEAIKTARKIVRAASSGQVVVHRRDGQIRAHDTYGMPPIQDPPGKRSSRIARAVGKITRERLEEYQPSLSRA